MMDKMNVIEYKKMIDEYKGLSSVLEKLIEDKVVTDVATLLAIQKCADIINNLAINGEDELKKIDLSWKPTYSTISKTNIDT